jgi:tRNA dimethylallyltransferase
LSDTTIHLALVGPTAAGKSALALAVARALPDVEIVSMDSMQVYRGMDIGTAKPTPAERTEIAHHVIDVIEPDEEWSVARFQEAARKAVVEIESRGHRALLVGGTGLYVQAVVDDLRFPGEDLALRTELEGATVEPGGVAAAYRELQRLDPEGAARIDEHNQRRIVRALEVIRLTGRPFSSFGPGVSVFGPSAFPVRMVGVWLPRTVLATRIKARVEAMYRAGLVDEARRLRAGRVSRTAAQAIGYREALAVLDGEIDAAGAAATAARRTRSFARRQRMWFRRDPRILWCGSAENPAALLPAVLAAWGLRRPAGGRRT